MDNVMDGQLGIPGLCEHDGCTEPALVGLNGVWLCMDHYEAAMKGIGNTFRRIMDGGNGD